MEEGYLRRVTALMDRFVSSSDVQKMAVWLLLRLSLDDEILEEFMRGGTDYVSRIVGTVNALVGPRAADSSSIAVISAFTIGAEMERTVTIESVSCLLDRFSSSADLQAGAFRMLQNLYANVRDDSVWQPFSQRILKSVGLHISSEEVVRSGCSVVESVCWGSTEGREEFLKLHGEALLRDVAKAWMGRSRDVQMACRDALKAMRCATDDFS